MNQDLVDITPKMRERLKANRAQVINTKPVKVIHQDNCLVDALSHPDLFSVAECEQIIELAPAKWEDSLVAAKEGPARNEDVRNNSNFMIMPEEDTYWLFNKLLAIVLAANKEQYKFDIDHFDAIQLSRYRVGEFYHKHMDIGPRNLGNRKISLTLQLSRPEDYDGGNLVLDYDDFVAPREQGSITLFPSFMNHWVEPVTRGTRYSLVSWVSGHNRFK